VRKAKRLYGSIFPLYRYSLCPLRSSVELSDLRRWVFVVNRFSIQARLTDSLRVLSPVSYRLCCALELPTPANQRINQHISDVITDSRYRRIYTTSHHRVLSIYDPSGCLLIIVQATAKFPGPSSEGYWIKHNPGDY